VSFAAITFYVASQRVFIVVSIYFVIDSVRKLLGTPSYQLYYISLLFYSSPHAISVMTWMGRAMRVEDTRNAYNVSFRKPEGDVDLFGGRG